MAHVVDALSLNRQDLVVLLAFVLPTECNQISSQHYSVKRRNTISYELPLTTVARRSSLPVMDETLNRPWFSVEGE